ncbi:hypothetical protein P7C73_g6814, partial [Tremellales sp. Uapishka_1]
MLRTSFARAVGPSLRSRSISSTSRAFVKVRSAKPPSPSPAEGPPKVPSSISTPPPPFEPIVSHTSPVTPADPDTVELPRVSEVQTPLTPPEPEAEVVQDLSKLPSLDIDPTLAIPEPEPEGGPKRTGAKGKEYVSSIERQRRLWSRIGLGALAVGGLGAVYYSGSGETGKESVGPLERMKNNFSETMD